MAMENRALLIGVAEYKNKRFERNGNRYEFADKSMPSAVSDVHAFRVLLEELKFDVVSLVRPQDTTRDSILQAMTLLFKDVPHGSQLVLYYSGHCARVSATGQMNDAPDYKDEVLCPSDTDWKSLYITNEEVMRLAAGLPNVSAQLEIVLETCSASGMQDSQLTQRFGKSGEIAPIVKRPFWEGMQSVAGALAPASDSMPNILPLAKLFLAFKGSCVFWGASQQDTWSYSGPKTPDGRGDVQGLFTRYFIEGFKAGKDREELKKFIAEEIEKYRVAHNAWHSNHANANVLPGTAGWLLQPQPVTLAGRRTSAPSRLRTECMPKVQLPYVEYLGAQGLDGKRPFEW